MSRICKKCLIGQQAEDYLKYRKAEREKVVKYTIEEA